MQRRTIRDLSSPKPGGSQTFAALTFSSCSMKVILNSVIKIMAKPLWSKEDLIHVRDVTRTSVEVARYLNRTPASVRGKRQRLGLLNSTVDGRQLKPTTVKEDVARAKIGYWKIQHDALRGKYETLLKNNTATAQLVEIAASLAPRSYNPAPKVSISRMKKGKQQSALLMLTDTHVGAVVKPSQTLGFGGYNFDVFLRRLKFLERGVESILTDHVSTDVPELVVCLGGDMIHGALNHGVEAGQVNTLFQQFYGASHALAQFLRSVSRYVPKIRVYTAVGNHPRWGHQHKMPTENRYSNLDMFLYAHIHALTRELKNVEWNLDAQPFALFDVQGFKFHLSHGDHLRGGDKALGIPNHAVARMVSATAQMFGKENLPSPHYFLTGHLHRSIVLPHTRGSVIVNGGFPGLDGFGLMSGFSVVDPSQTLFFIHPVYGKTATFDIQLKFAPKDGPAPYNIPTCGEEIT